MYKKYLRPKEFARTTRRRARPRPAASRTATATARPTTRPSSPTASTTPPDGIGAGLLARKGNVYYTCIPDLWLLKDTTATARPTSRNRCAPATASTSAFLGHDLHGLQIGPDGKLYFSIGDRGLQRQDEGRQAPLLPRQRLGPPLRARRREPGNLRHRPAQPAGTRLRRVRQPVHRATTTPTAATRPAGSTSSRAATAAGGSATSTCDARQVREQAAGPGTPRSSGTRRTRPGRLPRPADRQLRRRPLRPDHYPGTGLPAIATRTTSSSPTSAAAPATAASARSPSSRRAPRSSWSTLTSSSGPSWPPTCDFGPDGALYVTDWVDGWNKTGKGRIWKVTDPEAMKDPKVEEARKLIADGFDGKSVEELVKLLGHPHRQVRMEAQFALAAKGGSTLGDVAMDQKASLMARIHAIWGCGMESRQVLVGHPLMDVFREYFGYMSPVESLFKDPDPLIRAIAVRVYCDGADHKPGERPWITSDGCLAKSAFSGRVGDRKARLGIHR